MPQRIETVPFELPNPGRGAGRNLEEMMTEAIHDAYEALPAEWRAKPLPGHRDWHRAYREGGADRYRRLRARLALALLRWPWAAGDRLWRRWVSVMVRQGEYRLSRPSIVDTEGGAA